MTFPEYETFRSESTDYLKARIEHAKERFGIGVFPRYEYDLFRGEIWWSEVDAPKIRGRVTVVGSISTKSNTWLWAWANPHFSDIPSGDIKKVEEFGSSESIAKLTEPKWNADEVDGWEMTAIAARLLEAEGAYRSPSETGFLFLLYDRLEQIPTADIDQYMPLKKAVPFEEKRATLVSRLHAWLSRVVKTRTSSKATRSLGESSNRTNPNWPFSDPENVAVFTVADICDGRAPILRVCHDREDGAWQFLPGGGLPDKSQWRLLSLKEVVKRDPSVKLLAELPLDWEATRSGVTKTWITKPQE
jgi:hypothetical protein